MTMQYQTPIGDYVPQIQDFLRKFERTRSATNLIAYNKHSMTRYATGEPILLSTVLFKDPENPDEDAGAVTYERGADVWVVSSRLINNGKYRQHSREAKTKKTNKLEKALKIAQDNILPYSYREIASIRVQDSYKIHGHVEKWYDSAYEQARDIIRKIDRSVLLKEVSALKAMGVQFQTPEFAEMADKALTLHDEYMGRKKFKTLYHYVQELHDGTGRYAVATTENPEGSSYPKAFEKDAVIYNTFEEIPNHIGSMVAMLKMLGEGAVEIPEEGVRISKTQFVVFERVAKDQTV